MNNTSHIFYKASVAFRYHENVGIESTSDVSGYEK